MSSTQRSIQAYFFSINMSFFSYLSILNMLFGAQKNRHIETVLSSTHNMLWMRNKENSFPYTLLSGGLLIGLFNHNFLRLKTCAFSLYLSI